MLAYSSFTVKKEEKEKERDSEGNKNPHPGLLHLSFSGQ